MRSLKIIAAALLLSCGGGSGNGSGSANRPDGPIIDGPPPNNTDPAEGGPKIDAEVGALDKKAVAETFEQARTTIRRCFDQANEGMEMPVVGGEVEVVLRVKPDGRLRWAYPQSSTLGHIGAERCILNALRVLAWPKPQGGDEGIARTRYAMDQPARPPVRWSPGDLGSSGNRLTAKLNRCRRATGTSSLSLTMYVDPDGRVMAAGAAVGDDLGVDAIECAVKAAKTLKYPSPGSYPGKVTVRVE